MARLTMPHLSRRSALTVIAAGGSAQATGRAWAQAAAGRAIYPVAVPVYQTQFVAGLGGRQRGHWSASASPLFAQQAMERLALVDAAPENRLAEMLNEVVSEIPWGTQVVVISTRSSMLDGIGRSASFAGRHRHQRALGGVLWLDIGSAEVRRIFEWDQA